MPSSQFEFGASLVFAASEGRETRPSVAAFVQSPAWFLRWLGNDSHHWAPPPGRFSLPRTPPGSASPSAGRRAARLDLRGGANSSQRWNTQLPYLFICWIEVFPCMESNPQQPMAPAMRCLLFKFSDLCFLLYWPQVHLFISHPLIFSGGLCI